MSTNFRTAGKIVVTAKLDLGEDRGKPLGTLFQLRQDQPWKIVAAVGASQSFNHYSRSNPRMLHAHARRDEQAAFTATPLGSVAKIRYRVFVLDGILIDGTNREFFDEATSEWAPLPNPWHGVQFAGGEQINYAHRLGDGVLIAGDQGVYYAGACILSVPTQWYAPGAGCALYHDGQIFISWPDQPVKVFNWQPGDLPASAPSHTLGLLPGHFLRAFGILGNDVYLVTNRGGFIRHNKSNNTFTTIQSSFAGEFYCLQAVQDQLRLGDYPNGDQWYFKVGDPFARLSNYPPEEAGAGPNYRELQAMLLYGGDMICPTFPWGMVHRRHWASGAWHKQRIYTQPAITTAEGPYTSLLGNNNWAQRIPGGTLWKDGIVLSCSNTPGILNAGGASQVGNVGEYGKTWLLTRPHAVSAEIAWRFGPTEISLEVSSEGVTLSQDGVSLGSVPGFDPAQLAAGEPITLEVGNGLYGEFRAGAILGSEIRFE